MPENPGPCSIWPFASVFFSGKKGAPHIFSITVAVKESFFLKLHLPPVACRGQTIPRLSYQNIHHGPPSYSKNKFQAWIWDFKMASSFDFDFFLHSMANLNFRIYSVKISGFAFFSTIDIFGDF